MQKIKKNLNTTVLIISLLLFTTITILVFTDNITIIDNLTHNYILTIRNKYLTLIMKTITHSVNVYFLVTLCLLLLLFIKNKKIPLYIIINTICSFSTNELAKAIFQRNRPLGINLVEENSYSYPSGHSMVGLAFYGFIIYLIRNYIKNKKIKNILTMLLIINILTVGFSRIYLGVHYLSDILGGFLLGISYLLIYIKIIKIEKK